MVVSVGICIGVYLHKSQCHAIQCIQASSLESQLRVMMSLLAMLLMLMLCKSLLVAVVAIVAVVVCHHPAI